MSEKFMKNTLKGQTDRKRLLRHSDHDIDYSDIPATTADFWADAEKYVPSHKVHISIRLDDEIVDFFKKSGRGYQSKINAVLKAYMLNHIKATA